MPARALCVTICMFVLLAAHTTDLLCGCRRDLFLDRVTRTDLLCVRACRRVREFQHECHVDLELACVHDEVLVVPLDNRVRQRRLDIQERLA